MGRLVGSGTNPGVGIGAAGRMTAGIVDRGRGVAIRRGVSVGTGAAVGIGTALGRGTAVGTATFGSGKVPGATRGGTVIAGGSGEAIAGSTRVGASVAMASGVPGDAVQATVAISAKRTSGRTLRHFSPPRTKQVSGQSAARAT
jgi:hypothetical protein